MSNNIYRSQVSTSEPSLSGNNLTDQNPFTKNHNSKYRNKTGNACYCLNKFEESGPLNILLFPETQKLFISKTALIQFDDHFDELFEKGKQPSNKYDQNKNSAPDATYWFQRYYYYSKYDEGILMDNESKLLYNFI